MYLSNAVNYKKEERFSVTIHRFLITSLDRAKQRYASRNDIKNINQTIDLKSMNQTDLHWLGWLVYSA